MDIVLSVGVEDDIVTDLPGELSQQVNSDGTSLSSSMQWLSTHGHCVLLLYYSKHQPHILTRSVQSEILCNSVPKDDPRFTAMILQQGNILKEYFISALLRASQEGCKSSVSSLLSTDVNINAQLNGHTAIELATAEGYLDVVVRLLAAGVFRLFTWRKKEIHVDRSESTEIIGEITTDIAIGQALCGDRSSSQFPHLLDSKLKSIRRHLVRLINREGNSIPRISMTVPA